jgi:signal peptidase I
MPRRLIARIWNRENARWLLSMGLILLAVTSFRSAIADWNDVPTGSMKPTIAIGDRIFVNKLAYDLKIPFTQHRLATWGAPGRGDVVVFWSPADGSRLVKRCVAVPGDVVAMKGGRLWLNGEPLGYDPADRPRLAEDGVQYYREDLAGVEHLVAYEAGRGLARDFGPVTVPEGKFFMMGDNRDHSADSRYFGFADRSSICGRSRAVVASVDRENHWRPRWERFFSRLI